MENIRITFNVIKVLRQGEKVSPIMFSPYLHDLENYLSVNGTSCLEINDTYLNVYLKTVCVVIW